jgi:hypothetical protein
MRHAGRQERASQGNGDRAGGGAGRRWARLRQRGWLLILVLKLYRSTTIEPNGTFTPDSSGVEDVRQSRTRPSASVGDGRDIQWMPGFVSGK